MKDKNDEFNLTAFIKDWWYTKSVLDRANLDRNWQASLAEAITEYISKYLIETANTKINPIYDKYYVGYNDCIKELREAFGIKESEKGTE